MYKNEMSRGSPYLSAGNTPPPKKKKTQNPSQKNPVTNQDPFKNAILDMFEFQDWRSWDMYLCI